MEARSLVQHGPATLMVSLPAKWLKRNNLGKGDEIHVEEKGNELTLKSAGKKKEKREIEVKISSLAESSMRNILTNTYRLGYDRVVLNFNEEKAIKIIEEIVRNNLIGFEVIKKEKNKIIVENITEPSEDQFNNIFSKLLANIDSIFEVYEKYFAGEKEDFESTERQVQAFDNFCRRVISKANDYNMQLRWTFQTELVHAQRELYFGLKVLNKVKKPSKELKKILGDCKRVFELVKKAYAEKNIGVLEKIHELNNSLEKEGYETLKKSSSEERIIVHHILSSLRNFYVITSPLMGLFMHN